MSNDYLFNIQKLKDHRIKQHPDFFSGMTTCSTVSVLALTISPWLTMATDEEFPVISGLFLEFLVVSSSFPATEMKVVPNGRATADLGDSSKFRSVEAKSSECWGLSIERDSSVCKKKEYN